MAEIRADLVGDSRSLVKSIGNVGDALETVVDEMEDVAREGDSTERDLEKNFRDIANDAQKTGKSVGRDMDDGFDKAKRGAEGFKDEAVGTAKEAAASFDGSAESIGSAFQEVAANALEGFGPLGAAAGVAIAAGLGTGMAALEKFNEALDSSRDAAFQFAVDLEGRADIAAQIESWTSDMERFKQAQDIAYATGRDVVDVVTDLATGGGNLDGLKKAFEDMSYDTDLTLGRVTELNGVLQGTKEGFERGEVAAEAQKTAVERLGETTRSQASKTRQELEDLWRPPLNANVKVNVDASSFEDLQRRVNRGLNLPLTTQFKWE
jgi:broad specificity phosphatase PhoE